MSITVDQSAAFYQFLDTLDCYLTHQSQLTNEVQRFSENPQREIAAFITSKTTEKIVVGKGFIRLLYVIKGKLTYQLNGEKKELSAQGMMVTNTETMFSYVSSATAEVVILYFKPNYFSASLLGQFVEEPLLYRFFVEALSQDFSGISRYLIYDFSNQIDLHFYLLLLLKQVVKMAYFNNKVTKAAFVLLIVEMSQVEYQSLIDKDSFISNQQLAKELVAYIDLRLEQVTLEELADKFHFHPNYLSSLLKEKTGKTFTEWVLNQRIERCKNYLTQTDLTVQAIIERLGYKDKAFFYRRFKQIEGVTPRQYRKLREDNQICTKISLPTSN
ncbi:helix-turn-helix domain-containing protein [Enterococcus hermanniensis]|uniref:HTH araC/xylS-type domain-containing protein n=1 Tax=Enterococcus hermanniensis TaxID=249189 RepID=A0A1L8TL93_9ENTE|nr:helix-turn-helix transcriptional regulator [Enterococcus hermanniensis]OJG44928.1 hypothetical protein RV04_GL000496 [Enterococcus hermanniensis]